MSHFDESFNSSNDFLKIAEEAGASFEKIGDYWFVIYHRNSGAKFKLPATKALAIMLDARDNSEQQGVQSSE